MENTTDYSTYPEASVDPRLKGYDYILQYAKAAWSNGKAYTPSSMFYFGRQKMQEIYEYCMGKQSITKYRRILLGDDQTDNSWMNTDWTAPSFMEKFINIAIAKVLQRDFETEAFCVDPLAKSEEDAFFNQMKVKIMMREAAEQMGAQDISQSPVLQKGEGEPQDLEQLKMQMKYGYKHQKAMESELGISLVKNQNNIEEVRKRVVETLVKVGLGGYKEWIDPTNGSVKFREVRPENLITSYCLKNDFSDAVHIGEVLYISVADLAPYFEPSKLDYICKNVAGQYGNPNSFPIINQSNNRNWDKFKVAVLDLEFQSYNTTVYKKELDGRDNFRMNKSSYQNLGNTDKININGEAEPKYMDVTREVWYKTKWIIGTDAMYDYGLLENMKRKLSSWWATSSSFHLYAWNFHDMNYSGLGEKLIPFEDKACLIWYKMQNLANKLIPYIINLDLSATENVNMGKGGANWTPMQVTDFLFQNFVAVYRSNNLVDKSNPNYKPVSIEATGQLAIFGQYREELLSVIDMMRQVSGLNEATDASTIDQKTLNGATGAMMESTNNALYLISHADKQLLNSLDDAIVQRIQIAVKMGKVEGYAKALGGDTVRFYQISPDVANYELGIFTRPAPTYEERQAFYNDLNLKDSQGLIDPSDKIIIMSCTNLKQAAELLAYNIEKRKQDAHNQQMQLVQEQGQQNQQVAAVSEQAKQQTILLQHQCNMQEIAAEAQSNFITEQMKKQYDLQAAAVQSDGRTEVGKIMSDAKILAQQIAGASHMASTHITAQSKPKQKRAS